MHVVTWILTGLLAGVLARFVRGARHASVFADLTVGCLGAMLGGWLVHQLGFSEPKLGFSHVAAALLGATVALVGTCLLLGATGRAASRAGAAQALSALERQLVAKLSHRKPVARDPNRAFDEQMTLGQRMADHIAAFGGSWTFLGIFFALLLAWMIFNTERALPFDPYPFILLNLVLSCLAAVQAPVIMMSQNRQAAKDRLDARLDYEVNLKAELEILALHEKLDGLREKAWGELVALQERQLALLDQIERRSREERGS
jgi:uncharacterized membrane protein/uncharacterized membrane protein YeaQ/YmgE (transglycosylase-associated protein family)